MPVCANVSFWLRLLKNSDFGVFSVSAFFRADIFFPLPANAGAVSL